MSSTVENQPNPVNSIHLLENGMKTQQKMLDNSLTRTTCLIALAIFGGGAVVVNPMNSMLLMLGRIGFGTGIGGATVNKVVEYFLPVCGELKTQIANVELDEYYSRLNAQSRAHFDSEYTALSEIIVTAPNNNKLTIEHVNRVLKFLHETSAALDKQTLEDLGYANVKTKKEIIEAAKKIKIDWLKKEIEIKEIITGNPNNSEDLVVLVRKIVEQNKELKEHIDQLETVVAAHELSLADKDKKLADHERRLASKDKEMIDYNSRMTAIEQQFKKAMEHFQRESVKVDQDADNEMNSENAKMKRENQALQARIKELENGGLLNMVSNLMPGARKS